MPMDLIGHSEIAAPVVLHDLTPARLYELAVRGEGAVITTAGALATRSGKKTGRSPKDKRIVAHPDDPADDATGPQTWPWMVDGAPTPIPAARPNGVAGPSKR